MRKRRIEIGSRFVKTDDPQRVWVVTSKISDRTPMPHYVLVREDARNRQRTLSEYVLLDRNFYKEV